MRTVLPGGSGCYFYRLVNKPQYWGGGVEGVGKQAPLFMSESLRDAQCVQGEGNAFRGTQARTAVAAG